MISGKQQILLEYIRSKKGHNIPASHVMQMLGMTQEELRAAVEAMPKGGASACPRTGVRSQPLTVRIRTMNEEELDRSDVVQEIIDKLAQRNDVEFLTRTYNMLHPSDPIRYEGLGVWIRGGAIADKDREMYEAAVNAPEEVRDICQAIAALTDISTDPEKRQAMAAALRLPERFLFPRVHREWHEELMSRIDNLISVIDGAYDCVAEHGKSGLASIDNVRRVAKDVKMAAEKISEPDADAGDIDSRPPMPVGTVIWTDIFGSGQKVEKDPGGDFMFVVRNCLGVRKEHPWRFEIFGHVHECKIASWPDGEEMPEWYKDKLWNGPDAEEVEAN